MRHSYRIIISLVALVICASTMAGEKPSFDLGWYGYFKFDGAFDKNPTSHGNYVMWIPQRPNEASDHQFNMTANESRFGMTATGKNFNNAQVTGKLEFDLFAGITGASIAENKAMLQLRHAYFSLDWSNWQLTAGQTWDMISPLNPSTLNYPVLWGSGNIGYRRPQVSLRRNFKSASTEVSVGTGFFRTIGGDLTPTLTLATGEVNDASDDGTDAAIPTIQGILDVKQKVGAKNSLRFGVSGMYGRMKAETNIGRFEKYSSKGFCGHFQFTIPGQGGFSAEVFSGSNLGGYFGGVLQNSTTDGVSTLGSWASGWWQMLKSTQLSVGYGVDDPKDEDILSGRSRNSCVYANVRQTLVPQVTAAVELAQWSTKYKNEADASSLRIQTSLILNW